MVNVFHLSDSLVTTQVNPEGVRTTTLWPDQTVLTKSRGGIWPLSSQCCPKRESKKSKWETEIHDKTKWRSWFLELARKYGLLLTSYIILIMFCLFFCDSVSSYIKRVFWYLLWGKDNVVQRHSIDTTIILQT